MPVRTRITLLFSLLAFIILSLVCAGVYLFSYKSRVDTIKSRLTNRAKTTARLLTQKEVFDRSLIEKIDSSTTISLKDKTVHAFNSVNEVIYRYSDQPGDSLKISKEQIQEVRELGKTYFISGEKEAIGFLFNDNNAQITMFVAAEDVDGKRALNSLMKILLGFFLFGNVLVLISGYFFSKGLLLPIKKISNEVAEISAQNLARRINTGKSKDEWYELSSVFNDLLDRLQESFDLQRRFISNASHELSTPLTAILSQLEITLQREREAKDYKFVMQSIYQDVQHLGKLTQTLLEFAKASGNTGGLEINIIRIDEIILRLPGEIRKINSAYSLKIDFEDLPEREQDLLVYGNEALLLTAIKNIVINACKYSENHLAAAVLQVKNELISIKIYDNGPGIPKDELGNIFQPFYRIEKDRIAGGFGLGLPLADRIIKMHKGKILVHSTVGKGTMFEVNLPSASSLDS